MNDCIFCKIAAGEIPADIVYDDGEVLAFRDINPEAPVHLLLIPRRHIATLNDLSEADAALVGRLYLAGQQIAMELGVAESGYRTVINCNRDAGQLGMEDGRAEPDEAGAGDQQCVMPGKGQHDQAAECEGHADREPIASNDTSEGRAANRRIEIVLIREQAQ